LPSPIPGTHTHTHKKGSAPWDPTLYSPIPPG
jgi:hypothetical protein